MSRDTLPATTGRLFLIPTPLAEGPLETALPAETLTCCRALRHFVVERAKTARAFLKAVGDLPPVATLDIRELDPHQPEHGIDDLLSPLLAGHDLGLLSEAGCPAVADPGALLVRAAHRRNIPVVPLIGPSSILLALMASGLDGQRFAFHGYLPIDAEQRSKTIRDLDRESARLQRTQIVIETPYRNARLFQALLDHCHPETRLCIASQLTAANAAIHTRTIADWSASEPPDTKTPSIFLWLGAVGPQRNDQPSKRTSAAPKLAPKRRANRSKNASSSL